MINPKLLLFNDMKNRLSLFLQSIPENRELSNAEKEKIRTMANLLELYNDNFATFDKKQMFIDLKISDLKISE